MYTQPMGSGDEASMFPPPPPAEDDHADAGMDAEYLDHVSGEVPMEIQDIEHCGIEVDSKIKCFHGDDPIRKVAFEGVDTGRRFIACKNAKPCKFRIWYEPEWPPTLQRALQQLWGMVQTNQEKKEETEALVNQLMLEKMTFAAANASVTQEKNEVVQKKMQLELDVADMKDKYQRKCNIRPIY